MPASLRFGPYPLRCGRSLAPLGPRFRALLGAAPHTQIRVWLLPGKPPDREISTGAKFHPLAQIFGSESRASIAQSTQYTTIGPRSVDSRFGRVAQWHESLAVFFSR